jgi:hypothetical protein
LQPCGPLKKSEKTVSKKYKITQYNRAGTGGEARVRRAHGGGGEGRQATKNGQE